MKWITGRQSLPVILAVILAGGLAGCATPTIPGASPKLLDFLHLDVATREEVIVQLGQPSATFEQERILTYRLGEDAKQGYYLVTPRAVLPWQLVRYSLVLVFDDRGILRKKNLIAVQ